MYAVVCCNGNLQLAELELKAELRYQLKLERCAPLSQIGVHLFQPYPASPTSNSLLMHDLS